MSGNPFRRRQQQPEEAPVVSSPASSPLPPATAGSDRRGSKVKRVRIATPPPLSPDSVYDPTPVASPDLERASPAHPPTSYFAPQPTRKVDPPVDRPVHGGTLETWQRQEGRDVTSSDQSSSDSDMDSETTPAASAAPPPPVRGYRNPFERTLATMEGTSEPRAERSQNGEDIAKSSTRQTMDVDSFKRLLLTGKVAAPASSDASITPSSSAVTSSRDNTNISDTADASFQQSRLSLDEHSAAPNIDSPRTFSEAQIADEGDQESAPPDGTKKKSKPPPPKSTHGKPALPRTPQIVSFADFQSTEQLATATKHVPRELPPVPRDRASSDVAKKLPPRPPTPPLASMSRRKASTDASVPAISQNLGPSNSTSPNPLAMGPPQLPPPRLSRPRGESNSSDTSSVRDHHAYTGSSTVNTVDVPIKASIIGTSKSKAPPPPPARRSGGKTPVSPVPQLPIPMTNALTSSPVPAKTAISPSDLDSGVAPSPETSETLITPRPTTTLVSSSRSSSTSIPQSRGGAIPPPLPPRRRGSSKGSLDLGPQVAASHPLISDSERKASGASNAGNGEVHGEDDDYGSDIGARIVSVDRLSAIPSSRRDDDVNTGAEFVERSRDRKRSDDMLSDLDALQREIDALQERYRKAS